MKKFISILKASMSGDMNVFRFNVKDSRGVKGKTRSIALVIVLAFVVMNAMYTYAKVIGEALKTVNMTYVMLAMFSVLAIMITFLEGLYKSQGILFEAKDNNLLFSLPIKKSWILSSRLIKLIAFQYIFNFLFTFPAYVEYVILERPALSFYLVSIVMFLLVPVIPMIISCILGYFIKIFSGIMKGKKAFQTILTLLFTLGIFYISFGMNSFVENISNNATYINALITKLYYPIALYIDLIKEFDIMKFLLLICINLVPAILFIAIFSIKYFSLISKESEVKIKSNYKLGKTKLKVNSSFNALVKKELKKFFSIPAYIINTSFGLILLLILAILASVNFEGMVNTVMNGEIVDYAEITILLPKFFLAVMTFCAAFTIITASSVSLEGKSFTITKSLPVDIKQILLAKVTASNLISIPPILLSTLIVIIRFKFSAFDSLLLITAGLIMPTLTAVLGLIINLRYPMMNAKSDVAVIKQSMSAMVAVSGGMILSGALMALVVLLSSVWDINLAIVCTEILAVVLIFILTKILFNKGIKMFNEINV